MVTYRTITPHTSPPHSFPPPGQYSPLQLLLVNSINLIFTAHLLCCDSSCDPIAPLLLLHYSPTVSPVVPAVSPTVPIPVPATTTSTAIPVPGIRPTATVAIPGTTPGPGPAIRSSSPVAIRVLSVSAVVPTLSSLRHFAGAPFRRLSRRLALLALGAVVAPGAVHAGSAI